MHHGEHVTEMALLQRKPDGGMVEASTRGYGGQMALGYCHHEWWWRMLPQPAFGGMGIVHHLSGEDELKQVE